jgi:hypothetical protein
MTNPQAGARGGQIRLLYKIIVYVAIWITALLLTAPGLWPLAYMFPLGLIGVFDRHLANDGGWGAFIGLYIVYIVHGYFYFRSKTRTRTVILFGLLVLLLTCNVVGCREIIYPH